MTYNHRNTENTESKGSEDPSLPNQDVEINIGSTGSLDPANNIILI